MSTALGIPDRNISTLPEESQSPRVMDFVIQEHKATKRGKHYDFRISDGTTAFSWALDKWPALNSFDYATKQPDHEPDYMSFQGTIPKGEYGAGTVTTHASGKLELLHWDGTRLRFNIYEGPMKGEYSMIPTKTGNVWRFMNHTLSTKRHPELLIPRPKYKEIKIEGNEEKLNQMLSDPRYVFGAKEDGAHMKVLFKPNSRIRVVSDAPTEKEVGIIDHTYKFTNLFHHSTPKELNNTIVRAEAVAQDPETGKPVQAKDIGGILNSNTFKSREKQSVQGKLELALFDIVKYRGRDVSTEPYGEKLRLLGEVIKSAPKGTLRMSDLAYTESDKRKMFEEIAKGLHPLTSEGVVAWDLTTHAPPIKLKFKSDFDVFIREFVPGKGSNEGVGGFYYSHTKKGPVVGKVGTGFSAEIRKDMKEHPEHYIGLVARVSSPEKYNETGALRAPAYQGLHLEKNLTNH
jgi:bifunctional non-homologous end joining protein LigD